MYLLYIYAINLFNFNQYIQTIHCVLLYLHYCSTFNYTTFTEKYALDSFKKMWCEYKRDQIIKTNLTTPYMSKSINCLGNIVMHIRTLDKDNPSTVA